MRPNTDQIQSMIRWLFTVIGPLGAYLTAKGISAENLTTLVDAIIVICGAIPPIISFIWGLKAHTDASKIAAVEKMPDVKAIVTDNNPDPDSAIGKAAVTPDREKVVLLKNFLVS